MLHSYFTLNNWKDFKEERFTMRLKEDRLAGYCMGKILKELLHCCCQLKFILGGLNLHGDSLQIESFGSAVASLLGMTLPS